MTHVKTIRLFSPRIFFLITSINMFLFLFGGIILCVREALHSNFIRIVIVWKREVVWDITPNLLLYLTC